MATATETREKQAAPPAPATKVKDWPPETVEAPPPTAAPPASSTEHTQQHKQHTQDSNSSSSKSSKKKSSGSKKQAKGSSTAAVYKAIDPATSRNLLVILHGRRVDDELVRQAITELKAQGHQISVRVTFDRGDVDAFIAEAVRLNEQGTSNYQTIVAGGGDGTLNEVVCAVMCHAAAISRQGLAVALLPLGTANDFACVAGISVDPHAALHLALDPAAIQPIDVAAVNGQHFVNIAVAGSIAHVAPEELSSKWKRLLGPVAIGYHVLKRVFTPGMLQPHSNTKITFCPTAASAEATPPPPINVPTAAPVRDGNDDGSSSSNNNNGRGSSSSSSAAPGSPDIQKLAEIATQSLTTGMTTNNTNTTDGNGNGASASSSSVVKTLTADLLMLAAGNSRQMGRRVNVCPDALLDDGLLDFTLLTGGSMAGEAAGLLGALMSGDDHAAVDRGIAQLKASWLLLEAADDTIPVNRDGEPEDASNRLVFEVLHKALPFHLPDDRMLVAGALRDKQERQQLELEHAHSALSAQSEEDASGHGVIRGNVVTAGQVKSAGEVSVCAEQEGGSDAHTESGGAEKAHAKKRGRHKKLRKRTLQRMMFEIQQPEGAEVRKRQQLAALGKKLGSIGMMMLVGGIVGWAVRSRRERTDQQHKRAGKKQAASKAVKLPGKGRQKRRGSKVAVAYGV